MAIVFDWLGFAITAAVALVAGWCGGSALARKAARRKHAGAWRRDVDRYVGAWELSWPVIFSIAFTLGFVILEWLAEGARGVADELLGLIFLRRAGARWALPRSQIAFYVPIAVSVGAHLWWRVLEKRIDASHTDGDLDKRRKPGYPHAG
jgi:hypothetical protein